ncbi:geranylgeranyl transferase type-2 subunit alpha [Latimeria chalumnae]|uniref:geranylgeranyl transferase type-2 subunit alpha n=1 Tax=Latimeria chalumnae TaxID=7897 RepID=UPI0006D93558|nr:PREDICTED: geranylgeranyl transferase type-2 subunit alpha [Latimeria chalumnae]|eukprot:XP_014350255.1 PREDICTED: geranylgeranyl transferase type-2 subunit alpha [Latimeria chalumnae]
MHGRIKVKTTEEQQEVKRKEREKKLQLYLTCISTVFKKRQNGELDQEMLELTSQILGVNPDVATLWNYRREVFLELRKEKSEQEIQVSFQSELSFLESCLRVNPKSYGTWHHRCWVLDQNPDPDWGRELQLCNKFLEYDERNFHCWDYRRFVVQRSAVLPVEELAYTNKLISTNFSNYSSWHYRSKLLPLIHPDMERKGRVTEDVLLKEYEMVQNAFFTDPNDQSAWFYYRWLLGRAEQEESITCLYASWDMGQLVVGFSRPVNVLLESSELVLFVDGRPTPVKWQNPRKTQSYSCVWICELLAEVLDDLCHQCSLRVMWRGGEVEKECILYPGRTETWCRDSATDEQLFRCELSVEKTTVLQSELELCKQLQEIEPQNKWCILTIILLMRSLDPLAYEKETLLYFDTLKAADPMRTAYFNDLRSKFIIENNILKMEYAEVRVIDLSKKDLTSLCHLDQLLLVTHMNLSANQLKSLPVSLSMMQCLEVLEVDDNEVASVEGLYNLPRLEEVSLRNNRICRPSDLCPLATCPKLSILNLQGNPICDVIDVQSELVLLLPNVEIIM